MIPILVYPSHAILATARAVCNPLKPASLSAIRSTTAHRTREQCLGLFLASWIISCHIKIYTKQSVNAAGLCGDYQSIGRGTVRFKAQNRGHESRDRECVGGGNRYDA
jgi:hypothetical protein